jgi:hypothetical protein
VHAEQQQLSTGAPGAGRGLRRVVATRYVAPLREGGSLPGLVEADDDGLYVMKFRGAGQGPAALVAEVAAGELARSLGMLVPELVLAELDPALAKAEPDIEIQELAEASVGANLGVDFLPGALPFTAAAGRALDPAQAADVVWFDALVMNVDRTPRNPNLLVWHGRTWMIDHGAAFYRQHRDAPLAASAHAAFSLIGEHVLMPYAGSIEQADERLADATADGVADALARVPDEWLGGSARRAARRLRGIPPREAGGAARVRAGGRACPTVMRFSTRSCGWCRESSGASA